MSCRRLHLSQVLRILGCLLLLSNVCSIRDVSAGYEGTESVWHGFARYDFVVDERKCILVAPREPAAGRPWIWRARFFGHEPQADVALLENGFHLAYCDVGGLYGNASAVAHWDAFYAHLVGKYDLARKVALEGMSRGGLIVYNWAARNAEKVACIYADAPVCDIRSWPGGKGVGKGSESDWTAALAAYRLTEATAAAFRGNPIDQLAPLAEARVPILHVVGVADEVVPVSENSDVVEARYAALGGSIEVIRKPGIGHHPHALQNPAPIVGFVRKHVVAALSKTTPLNPNILPRSGLSRSGAIFVGKDEAHVAFIGGSITEMEGYRPMVCELLRRRFPATRFTFTDAGIASTCSTTGAFRLESDVLSQGSVDLLFVEFAVNDDQDAMHGRRECIRGMEGIIRHARRHNPAADIVVTYFVNPAILEKLQTRSEPLSIAAHDAVTTHYGVPTIHLAREVAERIASGRLSWQQFGGTHPASYGNRICADLIAQLFAYCWDAGPVVDLTETPALPPPLDTENYERGRFLSVGTAALPASGWELGVPDWGGLHGQCRGRFKEVPVLSGVDAGDPLVVEFEGAAVGAYVLAGPDAGVAEFSIDGGDWKRVPLYHQFSKNLHYPRTVMFASGLSRQHGARHTLRLKVSADPEHHGAAMRILQFVVN